MNDKDFLNEAINQSKESVRQGGFPAGTIIVRDGKIIGRGVSIGNILHDPTSHGEISTIRETCKNIKSRSLKGATIYSSMEPCLMCLGASMWAEVSNIVFACSKIRVSPEYYGGNYNTSELNNSFLRKIKISHVVEFENIALEVVTEWEKHLEDKS